MSYRSVLIIALINGFLAVCLGAFGAHALKTQLNAEMMGVFKTATQYHFYHTFALIGLAWWLERNPDNAMARWASVFFIVGILLFSGSLYLMSVLQLPKLGMLTPIGGLCFLSGWLLWAVSVIKNKQFQ